MTAAVVAVLVVAVLAVAGYVWSTRTRSGGVDQVDSFAAARAMTNRWSEDPDSTPQPLRDFLNAERRRTQAPAEAEDLEQ